MASSPQFRPGRKPSLKKPAQSVDLSIGQPAEDLASYRALVSRTVGAFGDEIKASRWLSLPNRDLGGKTPVQAAQSSGYDMRVLEPLLTRIEHGVDY